MLTVKTVQLVWLVALLSTTQQYKKGVELFTLMDAILM